MIGERKCRLCLADVRGDVHDEQKQTPQDVCGEAKALLNSLRMAYKRQLTVRVYLSPLHRFIKVMSFFFPMSSRLSYIMFALNGAGNSTVQFSKA